MEKNYFDNINNAFNLKSLNKIHLLLFLFFGLMPFISFGQTFVGPGTDWNTASNWSTYAVPSTAISGTIIINANCVLTTNLTVKNGGKLIVNYPATLTVGVAGNSATTQVVDFQNGSTVNVDFGASLVVLGLMNNSNNSTGVTFNGTVSVTGNVTAGNGSVIVGSGSLFATGSIVSANNGTILGTTNDCNSGPCNINASCSFTTSITGNQTVCSNTIPATLKGVTNASSPTYQWQSASSSGGGFSNISGANGIDYIFYSSLPQTTYYRLQVTSGGCTTTSTQVAVTINPTPTLTGLSQASVLCAGSGTTINLTGLLPNSTSTINYNIEGVSQAPVSVVANAAGLASFTSPVLNSNQYFQTTSVTTTNVTPNCTSGIYVGNTIAVRSVFTAGGIEPSGGDLICYNTVPTKTIGSNPNASGGDGNITYQWQYSTDNTFATGVTTLAINTSTYKPTQALTQTTYYRRQAKDGACNTTFTTSSGVFKVTVNPELYITLGANPQVTQLSTQVALPYIANNGVEFDILYTDPAAIAAGFVNLHGNVNGNSGNITLNIPYCILPGVYKANVRVITNSPACSSMNFPFTITVNPNTVYGGNLSSNQVICSGSSPSDLILTSYQGNVVKWQKASDAAFTSPVDIPSSVGINTLTGAMIGNLTQNTYFRAITNYSCDKTSSSSVLVAVGPIVTPTITTQPSTPSATCSGSGIQTLSVVASVSGLTYSWRRAGVALVNGGVISGQGTATLTLTNAVAADAGSYDVVINGTCSPSVPSNPVTVTVNALPAVTITNPAAVCSPGTINLTAAAITSGSTAGLTYTYWTNSGATTAYGTPTAATAGTYYIKGTNAAGCFAISPVTVTVNALPTVTITNPAAVCSPGTINLTAAAITSGSTAGLTYTYWTNSEATTAYGTPTAATAGTYYIKGTNAAGCFTISPVTVTVNALPTVTITNPAAVCSPGTINLTAVAITSGSTAGLTYTYWTNSGATTAYGTPTAATAGTYYIKGTNAAGCFAISPVTVAVNPLPSPPEVGTITQSTCLVPTGSFTITNYNTSYTYSVSPSEDVIITGDKVTAPAGSYTIIAVSGNCISNGVPFTISGPTLVTWNGVSWLPGAPTIDNKVVFVENYNENEDETKLDENKDIEACSCEVTSSFTVVFKKGRTLKVMNEIKMAEGAKLIFENNASLVQVNDAAVNIGNITYKRDTHVYRYDYTYWSSPVKGMTLNNLSPNTLFDRYFSYNNAWVTIRSGNAPMDPGHGYIIRGPQPYPTGPTATEPTARLFTGIFTGIPNNGVINGNDLAVLPNRDYLLGNPYPSAIDADKFLDANVGLLQGTLYFWTHNTAPAATTGTTTYKYVASDYASYNRTGGVRTAGIGAAGATSGSKIPSGKIGAGQGFFARSTATAVATITGSRNVLFNNTMRLATTTTYLDNSQFFKLDTGKNAVAAVTTTEKNRVWLNLTNAEGVFKQTLVGYVAGATNDYDDGFDGISYNGNQYVDFYSVNQDKNLVIQGRALPFVKKDSVALGYNTTIKGDFKISIDQVDGIFTTQNVLLEDKELKVQHDLKKEAYTFSTEKGTFNNRFVLRYVDKNAVDEVIIPEVPGEDVDAAVMVSVKDGEIKINSALTKLDRVFVYDVSGRKLFQKNKIDANVLLIPHFVWNHQVLIVDMVLIDGTKVSKKIIN